MQLCHIHFYQKIARKKVARVNAALHIKTASQWFSPNQVGGRVAIGRVHVHDARYSFKARLASFEFAKANCRKRTSSVQLVRFCIWNNHASEFWKKIVWTNASVKRNRVNTIKQLMSLKLAIKMLGERWSSKGGVLLVQNVWYVNAWNYSKKLTYSVSSWVGLDGAKSSVH